ncbi:hypothetical protein LDENG_00047560 [Lucifuga dentata]|nr:hypothetical protein LDENG_00047560 [Lucifuga dentata]
MLTGVEFSREYIIPPPYSSSRSFDRRGRDVRQHFDPILVMLKMMTKGKASHAEMIDARQSEGINVIFEQDTLPSPSFARSRSRSSSSSSRSSGSDRRAAGSYRRHNRSSSTSSSSSRSSSRSRSRSHPRCHRGSSCCRCHRNGYGRRHRSPPRRYRARSRSYSRSPSQNRSLHHRSYRSRSRSAIRWSTSRRGAGPSRCSRSPYRTYRSHSKQEGLCLDEKRELLRAARANAIKLLGVEHLELPESVKPLLGEQPAETKQATPEARVRPEPVSQKTPSQIT